jgi:predicted dienelactone hydrolase
MSIGPALATAFFAISLSTAHAAGLASIVVPADLDGPELKAFVWTPCDTQPRPVSLGPVEVLAVKACPIAGDNLPLIVISHGHGGSSLNHHDTAEVLADAGFVVVALNHPGDNFADLSRSGDVSIMVERPTDIKRLIDFVVTKAPVASKIDQQRIGFFGFSRGGYTGLVLAGAKPNFHDPSVPCPKGAPICGEIERNELPTLPLTEDRRIKAFVLADPLSFFSTKESLVSVNRPVQLWASEYGGDGVLPVNVSNLSANLPSHPDYHIVPHTTHFAFLAPCSARLMADMPQICTDQDGFDRKEFHQEFNAQVRQFFLGQLPG